MSSIDYTYNNSLISGYIDEYDFYEILELFK